MGHKHPLPAFLLVVVYQAIFPKVASLYAEDSAAVHNLVPSEIASYALISNTNGDHLCTGTFISKNHVLTAATCLERVSSHENLRIIYGSSDAESPSHKSSGISQKTTYEEWCKRQVLCFYEKYTDDVCILQLDGEVSEVVSIKIDKRKPGAGDQVTVFGWGPSGRLLKPSSPRRGVLTILDKKSCEERVRRLVNPCFADVTLPPKLSCAVSTPAVLGLNGDFGGPVRLKSARKIFGILIQRCPKNHPQDLNSNQVNLVLHLAHFQDFINDIVGPGTV